MRVSNSAGNDVPVHSRVVAGEGLCVPRSLMMDPPSSYSSPPSSSSSSLQSVECCLDILHPHHHPRSSEGTPRTCFLHSFRPFEVPSDSPRNKTTVESISSDPVSSSKEERAEESASLPTLHCLLARDVYHSLGDKGPSPTPHPLHPCARDSDCTSPSSLLCLRPLTEYPSTVMSLTVSSYANIIGATQAPLETKVVLFEGSPHEITHSLSVGQYAPRLWLNTLSGIGTSSMGYFDGYGTQSWMFRTITSLPETCVLYLWLFIQV